MYNCIICKEVGCNHKEETCPEKCIICTGFHMSTEHYCTICKEVGCNHTESYCPLRCTVCHKFHKTEHPRPTHCAFLCLSE